MSDRVTTPAPERFWPKVDVRGEDECWTWLAGKDGHGYGKFYVDRSRRNFKAHRFAYLLVRGELPELELDHLCRNPSCVNPAHLEPVTHRENMVRGNGISGRARLKQCQRGHPFDAVNTRIKVNGTRACRTCQRIAQRIRYGHAPPPGWFTSGPMSMIGR
jgi:hypothetical protein